MNTNAQTDRTNASTYDLIVAIDEHLKPAYAELESQVDQLQTQFENWLDEPTIWRRGRRAETARLDDELRAARERLLEARQWQWTRRVAGYANGAMFIAEA